MPSRKYSSIEVRLNKEVRLLRIQSLELEYLDSMIVLPCASFVTLSKFLNLEIIVLTLYLGELNKIIQSV